MRRIVVFLIVCGWLGAEHAHALRPFIAATDADVVEPGSLEIKAGLDFARNTRRGANETTLDLPSVEFALGIWRNVEVEVGGGFTLVRDRTEGGRPTTLASAQETSLGTKIMLFEGAGNIHPFATEFTVLFPTQRREFLPDGRRRVDFEGVLISTVERGPLRTHFNLGGGITRTGRGNRVGLFLWAVAAELELSEQVRLVSELRGASARRTLPDNTALLGFVWESPWEIKFDIAGFAGLTRGAWVPVMLGLARRPPPRSRAAGRCRGRRSAAAPASLGGTARGWPAP
jgi:hypothetical protein